LPTRKTATGGPSGCLGTKQNNYYNMTLEILLRYIHFISIFAIVGSLASEHILLKKSLTRREIGRLAMVDAVYGIAAMTLLAAGLTLWLSDIGKPSVFYTKNRILHTKITLCLLIGILSFHPTRFFTRQRKGPSIEMVSIPNRE